jgi:hypothetical protein
MPSTLKDGPSGSPDVRQQNLLRIGRDFRTGDPESGHLSDQIPSLDIILLGNMRRRKGVILFQYLPLHKSSEVNKILEPTAGHWIVIYMYSSHLTLEQSTTWHSP